MQPVPLIYRPRKFNSNEEAIQYIPGGCKDHTPALVHHNGYPPPVIPPIAKTEPIDDDGVSEDLLPSPKSCTSTPVELTLLAIRPCKRRSPRDKAAKLDFLISFCLHWLAWLPLPRASLYIHRSDSSLLLSHRPSNFFLYS
jgi:hypothetical protein